MRLKSTGATGARWMVRGFLLSLTCLLPLPGWLSQAVNWGSLAVFLMAAMAFTVFIAVNMPGLGELMMNGPETELPLPRPVRRPRPVPSQSRSLTGGGPELEAVRRALRAGTFSVNGMRYPGPPPVFLYYEQVYEACDDGIRLIQETRAVRQATLLSGPGSLTARGRISKSECDGCGVPMDVAWCTPGTPYLCRRCQPQILQ